MRERLLLAVARILDRAIRGIGKRSEKEVSASAGLEGPELVEACGRRPNLEDTCLG